MSCYRVAWDERKLEAWPLGGPQPTSSIDQAEALLIEGLSVVVTDATVGLLATRLYTRWRSGLSTGARYWNGETSDEDVT